MQRKNAPSQRGGNRSFRGRRAYPFSNKSGLFTNHSTEQSRTIPDAQSVRGKFVQSKGLRENEFTDESDTESDSDSCTTTEDLSDDLDQKYYDQFDNESDYINNCAKHQEVRLPRKESESHSSSGFEQRRGKRKFDAGSSESSGNSSEDDKENDHFESSNSKQVVPDPSQVILPNVRSMPHIEGNSVGESNTARDGQEDRMDDGSSGKAQGWESTSPCSHRFRPEVGHQKQPVLRLPSTGLSSQDRVDEKSEELHPILDEGRSLSTRVWNEIKQKKRKLFR